MEIEQQQKNSYNQINQMLSHGKLSELAESTKSEEFEEYQIKSNGSQDCQQKNEKQSQSTEHDFSLEQITLKNIKSKQQIEFESKQNQSIMLNLNLNIDDLFKKISSLNNQISTQLQSQTPSQYLKQKNLQYQNNLPIKQTNDKKASSTPQIQFKDTLKPFYQQKQYKPIFFQSLQSEPKSNTINMKLFQIGKSLGYGKFGQVVQCRNLKTNCVYALKKIFKSLIEQYKMHDQLLTQLKILSTIDHPNIVKAYQSFTDSYHIFILMEYVQGISLTKKFKCTQNQIKKIIKQVLNAIQYLHQHNICHRDLKPENIILTSDNTVKICDFGWASRNQKNMDILCGTLDYVPYQMAHQIEYTDKVDLWNVGVLTYELFYGQPPFKSSSKSKTFQNVKNISYSFSDQIQISDNCKNFIQGLFKPEDQRMTIEQALNHSFLMESRIKQPQNEFLQIQTDLKCRFEQIFINNVV